MGAGRAFALPARHPARADFDDVEGSSRGRAPSRGASPASAGPARIQLSVELLDPVGMIGLVLEQQVPQRPEDAERPAEHELGQAEECEQEQTHPDARLAIPGSLLSAVHCAPG